MDGVNDMEDVVRLLVPLGDVPLESRVTKRSGEKIYCVRNHIRVFTSGKDTQVIESDVGCRFLVSDNGDVNAMGCTTPVLWYADPQAVAEYLGW